MNQKMNKKKKIWIGVGAFFIIGLTGTALDDLSGAGSTGAVPIIEKELVETDPIQEDLILIENYISSLYTSFEVSTDNKKVSIVAFKDYSDWGLFLNNYKHFDTYEKDIKDFIKKETSLRLKDFEAINTYEGEVYNLSSEDIFDYQHPFSMEPFEKDYAHGISLNGTFTNNTDKTIKYAYIKTYYYNSVGERESNEVGFRNYTVHKLVGPLEPGGTLRLRARGFYSYHTVKVYSFVQEIEFMDGTKISG